MDKIIGQKNRRAFIEALRFLTFIEYDYPLE